MKIAKTSVTHSELIVAQYGYDPTPSGYLLTVRCPDHYDADAITADDIVMDDQIAVVVEMDEMS